MIRVESDQSSIEDERINVVDIRRKSLDLLARREHSRLELSRKLHKKFSDYNMIEGILDQLELDGLLSDDRFTEEYLNYRKNKGFGPTKISAELRDRGIEESIISKYIDANAKDWFVKARKVKQKKFGLEKPVDLNEKIRQQNFLIYRGFHQDHISCLF